MHILDERQTYQTTRILPLGCNKVSNLHIITSTANTVQGRRCMLIHVRATTSFLEDAEGSGEFDSCRCSARTSSVSHGDKSLF